jgi:pyruvate dehydrogenase E2 component (dihydrolipoamide acetyltransferase)
MRESLSASAQLMLHSSFDATNIIDFRKSLEIANKPNNTLNITVTDIIICAVSRVILKHKSINAHFLGDRIVRFSNAHIGVAVDTPRGLLVPTIRNANCLSLKELSRQAKVLFEKCRQGIIDPDLLKGASFTISNLGGLGIEMFTPILNPPQTGILGVCCVIERTKEGQVYPAMGLSLTFDHQALDGADAARFLKDLVQYLERFSFYGLEGGAI